MYSVSSPSTLPHTTLPAVLGAVTAELDARVLALWGPEHQSPAQVRGAARAEFGVWSSNLGHRLARSLGSSPQEVSEALLAQTTTSLARLGVHGSVAGGFLNLSPSAALCGALAAEVLTNPLAGVGAGASQRVVIDYSSPNMAKALHVGHLRSTVIGDCLVRVLRLLGHEVMPQNHVGDWGTPLAMLITQVEREQLELEGLEFDELSALYQRARARFENEAEFTQSARERVVALQSGEPGTLLLWQELVAVSMKAIETMYARLGSELEPEHVRGESAYNDALATVLSRLDAAGLLVESQGAACVFPGGVDREGEALAMIVAKSDGGYGYAATDLAALLHRVEILEADRVIYVVDARQSLHFSQVFATARAAGWVSETTELTHVAFGTVLGEDGKPFKTRSGTSVSLSSLLDGACAAAAGLLAERGGVPETAETAALAEAVGIGAVKYADLSNALARDYKFELERMVTLAGDTGPYLQYAHVRVCSLLSRVAESERETVEIQELADPHEQRLALALAGWAPILKRAGTELAPHLLCTQLREIATALSGFYEHCPVLSSSGSTRSSRLGLCEAARGVLSQGLGLLGIEAPERM